MPHMDRFAVILTHNRPELLLQTVKAVGPQVDMVVVVDNASDPPVRHEDLRTKGCLVCVINVPDQPPNLSALWQVGIDAATGLRQAQREIGGAWHIAFLCDDAPPPVGWFDAVVKAMAETGSAVGCSPPDRSREWAGSPRMKYGAMDGDIMGRMPGWAFILDPGSGVRPDPQFQWWFGDTDIDAQARRVSGMVMIGSHSVQNLRPNDFTVSRPELSTRAGLDREAFAAKWAWAPW